MDGAATKNSCQSITGFTVGFGLKKLRCKAGLSFLLLLEGKSEFDPHKKADDRSPASLILL